MFSVPKSFQAPPIQILPKPPVYEARRLSEFITGVKQKKVDEVVLKPNQNKVYFSENDGTLNVANFVDKPEIWKVLIDSDVDYDVDLTIPFTKADIGSIFITFGLSYAIITMMISQMRNAGPGGPFNLSNTVELEVEDDIDTRFGDVQGIDSAKEELEEIVNFLRAPEKYFVSGAKIPKGALLTGKPGTGKTLLARAIAGESSVPFIQCSGSSFIEMYVGLGAKRVRDVFEVARKNEPCIVFIDEIDAIGKQRSGGGVPANDEREQTINQLLTEMDGFDNKAQIVVIAATNRVDILDEALLRPGRFDRKIQVNLPDVHGREKILEVHSKNKNLSEDVSLRNVARQTTGFSGADLANLMNEAAIRSVGNGIITPEILENAYQRVVVGAKSRTVISSRRKIRVAYHEAGHALIGALMPEYDEVRKVSIIPRGDAGGVTFFQPMTDDVGMYTKEYLLSQIKVALGGHAAEELFYGKSKVTTGATNDFSQVYTIARQMVLNCGFSNIVGKINVDEKYISTTTMRLVDMEIKRIVDECYDEVMKLLRANKTKLEQLKDLLIEQEIVDGDVVYEMVASCHVPPNSKKKPKS
jgi:cell division protease FtsH